jgi:hypothetical protein
VWQEVAAVETRSRRKARGQAVVAIALAPVVAIALATGAPTPTAATVPPSLDDLLARSSFVLVASVAGVEAGEDGRRQVTLRPRRFLKGELQPFPAAIRVLLRARPRPDADFDAHLAPGAERIWFLRHVPDGLDPVASFHLELADSQFGVKPVSDELLHAIESSLRAAD